MKKLVTSVAFALGALLVLPALAFAHEGEAAVEESASGIGLLLPKLGEWIPMLLAFIILWIVLAKFAWPAFMGMIDKRTATIKDSLERAESAKIESEHILVENQATIISAKKQAAEIIADAKVAEESVRAEITAKAQQEAQATLARAVATIETEKKVAVAELQSSVADLSISVVGRLIGADLSDDEHRRIIERYIAEAGDLDVN
ncbi:MAG: F0F1 ATP synthase subunit B [Coriobacteriales bacterium]|jgi:F-type H+-transporting ATPase subunit b|nr:F0F1 ATP synthase subunit B [Coriobacteriales bacterium]